MRLFSEIKIADKTIKNRVVLPPMVLFGTGCTDGFVTDAHINHYEKRAKGGAGLIIIEAACIDKNGRLSIDQLGIWDDKHIEGLQKITEVCHKHGAVVMVQIHHAGLKTPDNVITEKLSSSNHKNAREMTNQEVTKQINNFVSAAIRAEKAGFDGIELHAAHGYLLTQFLSPKINKRTDNYGGSRENRASIVLEIIAGIKQSTDKNFICGIRFGSNEATVADSIYYAKQFENAGANILHMSFGFDSECPSDLQITEPDFNEIVNGAIMIQKNVSVPVIAVNGIKTPEQAEKLLSGDIIPMTAIGRGFLADASWAVKAMSGEPITLCTGCKKCSWFLDSAKCPVYN